jgi:hypothetical protein
MYQFITMPIPQSQGRYMVAYEFEDIMWKEHLLEAGQSMCYPPYLEIGVTTTIPIFKN